MVHKKKTDGNIRAYWLKAVCGDHPQKGRLALFRHLHWLRVCHRMMAGHAHVGCVQGGFLADDNKSDTRSEFEPTGRAGRAPDNSPTRVKPCKTEQSVATFGLAGPCDCQRRRLDPRCLGHLQDDPAGC